MSEFETFYREHVQLVYGIARSRSGEAGQAEDLTQDTFLRAWQHFDLLAGAEPAAQRAWLVRTLRNLSIDVWRRRSLAPMEPLEAGEAAASQDDQAELRIDLAKALAALDEEDREMVMLRYLEDLNSREIGELLGLPEGTVRRRLSECRRILAEHLAGWAPRPAETGRGGPARDRPPSLGEGGALPSQAGLSPGGGVR
jgi:RNA polymerase sigma-70 factor (ECF subfamily)